MLLVVKRPETEDKYYFSSNDEEYYLNLLAILSDTWDSHMSHWADSNVTKYWIDRHLSEESMELALLPKSLANQFPTILRERYLAAMEEYNRAEMQLNHLYKVLNVVEELLILSPEEAIAYTAEGFYGSALTSVVTYLKSAFPALSEDLETGQTYEFYSLVTPEVTTV